MFQDGKVAIGVTFPWTVVAGRVQPDGNRCGGVVPLPAGPNGTRESAVMWMAKHQPTLNTLKKHGHCSNS